MIQISNISMISTDNILGEPLPLWAAAVAVLGVLCFMVNPIIAVGMIVIGGAVLFSWSKTVSYTHLTLPTICSV